ncbi:MAG: aminodeoxychorismate synthase component I [Myxococcota bacterium]|nr:aminodeoxychorismate synthase component I [Myxococcota bacterium]
MHKIDVNLLIVDNYDSFTFNLYQYASELCAAPPIVVTNDHSFDALDLDAFDAILISPGPGSPEKDSDFGICGRLIETVNCPILGVCLGHQGIAHVFGGTVTSATEPMHGRESLVRHNGDVLFADIPESFNVIRYHSLIVSQLPDSLIPIAHAGEELMALRHRTRPIWGVQFHPESIGTEYGKTLLANFLKSVPTAVEPKISGCSMPSLAEPDVASTPQAYQYRLRFESLPQLADAESVFEALYGASEHAFWLDSTRIDSAMSRFSYMGGCDGHSGTRLRYNVRTSALQISTAEDEHHISGPFFDCLSQFLSRFELIDVDAPFDFRGGLVGYVGYEIKGQTGGDDRFRAPTDDALFFFVERFIVFDHLEKKQYVCALETPENKESVDIWFNRCRRLKIHEEQFDQPVDFRVGHFLPAHSRDEYLENIEKALEYIRSGESYEVCLTTQFTGRPIEDPLGLYRQLRRAHDVPFGAFLKSNNLAIASASPERFLKISNGGHLEAKPIKGTAERSNDSRLDSHSARQLASSEKERSENLMIVDLLRNDLGRVAQTGTVTVDQLMNIESYAVHQMVSTISGQLKDELHALDALKSCFPGGSMTGAPKLRTLEIIDRLEGQARGVYSGCLGYISLDGGADFNIVIRSLVMTPESTTLGVGGAIVYLSEPEAEWGEVLLKARSVLDPLHGVLVD